MDLVDVHIIQEFEKKAKNQGVPYASMILLRHLGIDTIEIKGEIPASGPLLIISNHPGAVDSIVIFATVYRKDFYKVVLKEHFVLGNTIESQMIPIYRGRTKRDQLIKQFLQLYIPQLKDLPSLEIRRRNRESITLAAKRINQKHAVVIFPEGSAGKRMQGKRWKIGVGYLAEQVIEPRAQIIFAYISGTHKLDILRYLHRSIRNLLFRKKTVSVTFSKPELLKKYITGTPRDTAIALEKRFKEIYS